MTMTDAMADVASRISEIQSRFGVPAPAATSAAATPFSQVLAAASLDPANGATDAAAGIEGGGLDLSGVLDGSTTGGSAVAAASKYLGVPYVWGGTNPSTGLDCSGLVQRAYRDIGVELPRVAADQARMGTPVAGLDQARPGDLVAFGSPVDHIGIYAGNGKMVVAPHRNDVVKVQDITVTPTAIRRIIPDTGSGAPAVAPGTIGIIPGPPSAAALAMASSSTGSSSSSYDALFASAGAKYGVDPKLLSAIARAESGYNPSSVSGAGAQGLMQLMPTTARSLGVDPFDPAQAVDGAARMMAGNLAKFGSVDLAVAAYNAGAGAVSRYGGVPPYAETQNYVRRVLSYAGASA